MLDFLKKDYPGIHPLNRLDFETSGVVLFARTKKVLSDVIDGNFRGWKKIYRTLVAGRMTQKQGEITMPLPARTKGEGNVSALTRFHVLERFEKVSYVEVEIETGRHHQIRKHLSMIHHPLILDEIYGDEKMNRSLSRRFRLHRFFLHAFSVDLPHPVTGQPLHIEAPMPKTFEIVLELLQQ